MIVAGAGAALLAVGAAGCASGPKADPAERVVPVRTVVVAGGSVPAGTEYVGVVEEESAVALSFREPGTVEWIGVCEGQRIRKGQLLAVLDTANLRSAYDAALATRRQAEDAMKRLRMLYDGQSLPEIKYVEAETKLEQARATEQIARRNLADSRLVAPAGGVIGRRSAEPGENVMAGQTVLSLLNIGTVKVRVSVPENEIASLAEGTRATVTVGALGGRVFEGRVTEKGVEANPLAHTYEARIRLDNGSGALLPGMVCRVRLAGDAGGEAIVVPAGAVQTAGRGERFVWCVREGRAERVAVTTGALVDGGVVVADGLVPGDEVITDGCQKVSGGMKVEVL